MNILVMTDKDGGEARLTTQSPCSRYGIPVLQITAGDIDGDFGPGDLIDATSIGGGIFPAARVVAGWARSPGRSPKELEAARIYLGQWPEGPQV